jgi:acyl-CoA synthetase (AMP-forming)/AMP-acid ligase II
VRGPTVALRLQKVQRADVFTVDGFLRTGDLGVRHGRRVSFLGRIGDMIKTSGANVSPPEVERELQSLDGVAAAHVVGLDDNKRGQVVAAAVVRVPGSTLTADDIRARLRERLSVYKVPRAIVFFDSSDQVPMTPTMKVRKRELAELIAQGLEAREAGDDGSGSGT